jgi:molybdopterin converting factor subunit 1
MFRLPRRPTGDLTYSFLDMKVRILYFGVLKEMVGHPSAEMDLPSGSSVGTLIEIHEGQTAAMGFPWRSIAAAVNREYAQAGDLLHDGDEVALLPPVSGGWL